MANDLSIRVLGPVGLHRAGAAVPIGGAQQRRVMARLSLDAGKVVQADLLAEAMWPDGNLPGDWRGAIRVAVSRLRSALGDEALIVSVQGGYRLDVPKAMVDCLSFEDDLRGARARKSGRATAFQEALDYWQGNAFSEFSDEPWIQPEAQRYEELRLVAVEFWAEAMIDSGRSVEVIADLQRWRTDHPLREPFCRLLMQAFESTGRNGEAIETYQSYRRQLASAVGLDPSADLQQRERSLLASDELASALPEEGVRGYEIGERIGEGAFSVVYRGRQASLDREVAVKVIRGELANRPEFIRRFEAEAHMVAHLEHPNVVPLYDYWRQPDRAYLVMRWLRGGSLESQLDRGPLAVEKVLAIGREIASALDAAHASGIVHRDVKPANILLDEEGRSYLTDFGIALDRDTVNDPTAALSAGSPAYASPEQLRKEVVTPAADVHGLAISLFEAFSGTLPFPNAKDQATLLQHQLEDAIPSLSELIPTLNPVIDSVFAKATAKNPADRQQSASEFIAELEAAISPEPRTRATSGLADGRATLVEAAELSNPYKGLRAFQEADAVDFAGRDRLVDELVTRLAGDEAEHRFLAVVGPSGSGKSSVVRAGLLPSLRRGRIAGSDQWFYVSMVPGTDPFEELETALLRVAVNPPSSLMEQLRSEQRGILRAARRILPDDEGTLVLFIDQFEELFTLCEDEETRARFIGGLLTAVCDPASRIRVVLTLRADFFDRPLRYGELARLMKTSAVAVAPLAPDELERAIVDPVRGMGVEFEGGLVAEIVADVADQPGSLPLLQYALTLLFDQHRSGLLTLDAYRELGGVTGALAATAEQLWEASDDAEQQEIRRLFGRLVTLGEGVEATRRRVIRAELGTGDTTDGILSTFGDARLLSFDREPVSRQPTVEVAHEALLQQWPRLRGWLEDDRHLLRSHRQITDSAQLWEANEYEDGELHRGGRLEATLEVAEARPDDLNELERRFVESSEAAAAAETERERQHLVRLRRLLTAVAVLAVLAILAGVVAFIQRGNAQDGQQLAVEARQDGETRRMASDAAGLVEDSPQLAALLAAEAHQRDPSHLTLGALQRVLTRTGPTVQYVGTDRSYTAVAWLPGEGRRVAGLHSAGVDIHDLETDERTTIGVGGTAVAVSPDGTTMAVATEGDEVMLLALPSGEPVAVLEHAATVRHLVFGDGLLATGDREGWLRLWNQEGKLVAEQLAHPEKGPGEIPDELLPTEADRHETATLPLGVDGLLFHEGTRQWISAGGIWLRLWDANLSATEEFEISRPPVAGTRGERSADRRVAGRPASLVAPDASTVALVADNWVQQLDVKSGILLTEIDVTPLFVEVQPAVFGAGSDLLVVQQDGRIISLTDGRETLDITRVHLVPVHDVLAAAISPDLALMAVGGGGGLAIIGLDGRSALARTVPQLGQIELGMSPTGEWMSASHIDSRRPNHWDLTVDPPQQLPVPDGVYRSIVGVHQLPLAQATDHPAVRLTPDGSAVQLTLSPEENVWSMTDSPDGQFLAVGRFGEAGATIDVLDAQTAELLVTLDQLSQFDGSQIVSGMAFSPDGSRLAAATETGAALLWDTSTWEQIGEPLSHGGGSIFSLEWSPDGSILVTGGASDDLLLRNGETGQPTGRVLVGASNTQNWGEFRPFTISEDGRFLMSAGSGSPTLFDLTVDQPIGDVFPSDSLTSVMASTDWTFTVLNERIHIWNLDVDAWPQIACRFAGRNLTVDEWDQFGPAGEAYRATCPEWPDPTEETNE